ncbi:hypothetical protein [Deinococcus radiotolerans]|uniref:Uncharacterized protein n=1 Tax=Deinococcus radiotolerans TaxID=1309407 RepID=A0ABQ2FQ39_9DEIO|nr:hypothetical protein [Deinococcus radiotolerans]GGL15553.1 hypothetical protein GCM10010844_38040 [Deinococcus radiotolerans]
MITFLYRLLGRRPAATPEPELPVKSYAQHVEEEVRGLTAYAERFSGTHLEPMYRDALARTQVELNALTTPEVAA